MTNYFIKSILCSALFLVTYKALFEREKMHYFNRFFLLLALVLPFVIPLFTFTTHTPVSSAVEKVLFNSKVLTDAGSISHQERQSVNYKLLISLIIYLAVTTLLVVRFISNLDKIFKSIKENPIIPYKNAKLVLISQNVTPHSFLNYILVYKEDYTKGLENEILIHELLHVRQMHSLDILLIEVVQMFFWFNPFLLPYKKAIQLNHEFLADEAVTYECKDLAAYQYLIINKANKQSISSLTSPLNYLITKKRLIMMTKTRSFMKSVCIQAAIIPVLAASVFLFSTKAAGQQNISSTESSIQQGGNRLDTSLKHMLMRYLEFPKSVGKGENGIALIHVSKSQGSIMLKTVYTSNKDYNIGVDQRLIEVANRKNVPVLLKEDVVVPVFFYGLDDTHKEGNANLTPAAKKVVDEMGGGIEVSEPVIMITYRN